jgi:two-component system response regulator FixJ
LDEDEAVSPNGTVFVVDDDAGFRQSLVRILQEVNLPVQAFDSAAGFLEAYAPGRPGCLVADLLMPGVSGMELHKKLRADGIEMPVIIVSAYGDVPTAVEAMQEGAMDFIEKPIRPRRLIDRIRQALAQDSQRRRSRAERSNVASRLADLTRRERQVVDLVVAGLTNKAIAARLGVCPQAIDAHRTRAMAKIGAETVPELVRLVLEANGTVSDPAAASAPAAWTGYASA